MRQKTILTSLSWNQEPKNNKLQPPNRLECNTNGAGPGGLIEMC